MFIGDMFNILSDNEKDLMYIIATKWHKEKQRKIKLLREENKISLINLTKNSISPRLLTALLDYHVDSRIDSYHIRLIDVKNVRGIGKELIKEYNNLFKK
jgi:hypothetical protein